MSNPWIPAFSILACLAAAPAVGSSDAPGAASPDPAVERVEEAVEVGLHLIDVLVTDRKGRPLTGLEAGDFRVRVDGGVRPIVSLDRPDAPAVPPPAAGRRSANRNDPSASGPPPPSDRPGRYVAVLLDADRMSVTYRQVALDAASRLIRQGSAPDRYAVVLLRNGVMEFLQPFAVPEEIDAAAFARADLLLTTGTEMRVRVRDLVELLEACPDDDREAAACARNVSREFLHEVRRESGDGVRALHSLVAALGALPGRKALVWLSDGLVLQPADVVLEALRATSPEAWVALQNRIADDEPLDYERLLQQATRSRVTVFSLRTGRDLSSEFFAASRARPASGAGMGVLPAYRSANRQSEASLTDVARATGGRAILTPLDESATSGLLDALDAVYTLGVAAFPEDRDGVRIRVRLPGEKARVRFLEGPRRPAAPTRKLAGRVEARRTETGGVVVILELDPRTVQERSEHGERTRRISVHARLLDPHDSEVETSFEMVSFPSSGMRDGELTYRAEFPPAPAAALLDVSATDVAGGGAGAWTVPLD